jgi:isochorismate hydrolase
MGQLLSFLPSVARNTMCCVNVTTRRSVCYQEPVVQYTSHAHKEEPHQRTLGPMYVGPATSQEYDATIDVYAPVDTDRMLAEAHFELIRDRRV